MPLLGTRLWDAYVAKLIGNARITRYLDDNHPEMLIEFRKIASATSLDTNEDLGAPNPKDAH
jgi:hypothetical protein